MDLKLVTVFGGTGFIGRYVVRRLAKTGAIIRVGTRHPERAGLLRPMGNVGQIVALKADILDDAAIASAVDGADAVINLVGILAETGRQRFQPLQGDAPGRIASAAAAAGAKRLVQLSAIGADASSPSAYARSKAAGEAAARAAFATAVILRPSIVFGPEDQFFNRFAAMTRLLPFLPLIGGGSTRMQPVYVGDVAEAVMAALLNPATSGRTFELGGPRIHSFRELMEITLRECGRKRALVSIPWGLAMLQGAIFERLPGQLITRDQVTLLRSDNVVAPTAATFADLAIHPTALETMLPTYLDRFRVGGRFASRPQVRQG